VAGLLGGLAARRNAGWAAALLWCAMLVASTIFLLDVFSYGWLSLHVTETAPLLMENIKTDFQVMPSKMRAAEAGAAGYVIFVLAGASLIRHGMRRTRCCVRPVPLGRLGSLVALATVLLAADRALSPRVLDASTYEAKTGVLWQPPVYAPRDSRHGEPVINITSPRFRQVPNEGRIQAVLDASTPAAVTRPLLVFLFVVESLREDAITEDGAPNLSRLRAQSLPVQAGIAAANVTHISWLSILHAQSPLYWSVEAHQTHSAGATPIRLLRRLGYRVNALASPNLGYFGFAQSVFADNAALANTLVDQSALYDPATGGTPGDLDDKVMARVGRALDGIHENSREFFLVMLDAPHHDYTWARRYQPKFLPFSAEVSVLGLKPSSLEMMGLKHRYQNAVNFVDTLIGEFMQTLEARGLLERSLIVVTGDHGEEFLERGHLVHASELNRFQTHVPILIRMPASARGASASIVRASHLDIFPTIFDALGVAEPANTLLEGHSLLRGASPDSVALVAMTSTATPSHLLLDGGEYKLALDLEGSGKVGRVMYARRLLSTKVVDRNDAEVVVAPGVIWTRFGPAIRRMLADP
jgi:hypothetical protein